jgi:hypothetical protein
MDMKPKKSATPLERLIEPLSDCLTEETARRLVSIKPDRQLQTRVNQLARKCSDGNLTPEEREEYARYISFGDLIALLKAKARLLLTNSRTA